MPGPAYGVACADFDNDGDVDILVTRLGPNALLRNDGPPEAPGQVGVRAFCLPTDRQNRLISLTAVPSFSSLLAFAVELHFVQGRVNHPSRLGEAGLVFLHT